MSDKAELRAALRARRETEPDRGAKSRTIATRTLELPECVQAGVVASYVGVGSEVGTADLLDHLLAAGKTVAVPWRRGGELEFAVVAGMAELEEASFGLLEPPERIRNDAARCLSPERIDLFLMPGLGFDRQGGRLGQGRGFYDRYLRRHQPLAPRVGLAFECQLVDRIPRGPSDEPVDLVVTELAVYRISGRTTPAGR